MLESTMWCEKQATVDIRLRPGPMSQFEYTPRCKIRAAQRRVILDYTLLASHAPWDLLWKNMTSSTKPEVHNILKRRKRRNKQSATSNMDRKLCEIWRYGSGSMRA